MSNLQKVKTFIKTPHLHEDPFIARKENLLNTLLWVTLLFTLIYTPIAIFIVPRYQINLLLNLLLAIATTTALIIFHKGHLFRANIVLLLAIWLYISLVLFYFGGIASPATISFVFFILVSGLLLEERGIITAVILSMISCTAVWFLEMNGRLPEILPVPDNRYWFAIMVVLIISSAMLYVGIRSHNNALNLVKHAKEDLTQLITTRTQDLTIANQTLLAEIATREQIETAFQESEARFQHLFNSSPDAMFLMDPEHPTIPWMIIECNQAACKMNGYTREELIGTSIFILDSDPNPQAIDSTSTALFRNKTILFEGGHKHKDGHVFPIEVALTMVTFGGKEYLLGQDRDITRRRETEDALKQAHELLEQRVIDRTVELTTANQTLQAEVIERQKAEQARHELIEELEAKNKELEQFSYTVSHDLKSPLITIRGFLGFLENDLADGKTERAIHDIQRIASATDKMQAMLDNLLELSRIGRISNPPTAVSLNFLITETLERLDGSIREQNVTLSYPSDTPDVFVDPTRLIEVFQNLIGNAIKFMGDQPKPTVDIFITNQTEEQITCAIKDNGIGISSENQLHVFELFERVDEEVDGTGIGLALVKRIVEVHNGRVWVESEGVGHGSTFFITLPKPTT